MDERWWIEDWKMLDGWMKDSEWLDKGWWMSG